MASDGMRNTLLDDIENIACKTANDDDPGTPSSRNQTPVIEKLNPEPPKLTEVGVHQREPSGVGYEEREPRYEREGRERDGRDSRYDRGGGDSRYDREGRGSRYDRRGRDSWYDHEYRDSRYVPRDREQRSERGPYDSHPHTGWAPYRPRPESQDRGKRNEQPQGYPQQSHPNQHGQFHNPPRAPSDPRHQGQREVYTMPQQGVYGYDQTTINNSTVVVTQPTPNYSYVSPPADQTAPAVLVCLCCCWLTGIFAILKANEANYAKARGDMAEAHRLTNDAKRMIRVSLIIGIILNIVAVVVTVTVIVVGFNSTV